MFFMQDESKLLYTKVAEIFKEKKLATNQNFTNFCVKNGLASSTYDDILNARTQATFYTIFKVLRANNLKWEDFGRLLDDKLPETIWEN